MRLTQIELQKYLGRAVRMMRKEAGYSQEAFALEANLNRTFYGNIERSEENISLSTICKICCGLDKAPSELFLLAEKLADEELSHLRNMKRMN